MALAGESIGDISCDNGMPHVVEYHVGISC